VQKYIIILKPPNFFGIIFLVFFLLLKKKIFGEANSKKIPDLIRRDILDLIEGDSLKWLNFPIFAL